MPRRKFVDCLRTICLRNIAKNMDDIWCVDYTKNFLDKGNFLYFIGPFECLTASHIQELINILVDRKLMKRYYLHLLIDSRLTSLDLSVCKLAANKDSIINLVTIRCQRLTSLNIALCNAVSSRILADLAHSCTNLQHLNLQRTKCNDQVLAVIGNKCRQLRELNVSGCPITDMGIMSLCVSFDPSFRKCEKLLRLDVTSTTVTVKGARVAVDNLRNLAVLMFPDVCDVVYRARQEYLEVVEAAVPPDAYLRLRLLTLSHFASSHAPVSPCVEIAARMCPLVTEVHLTRGADDACVLQLTRLTHLRVLHVGNSGGGHGSGDEERVTFGGGLLPLLQLRGHQLTQLCLHEVNHIDIGVIGACCPVLRKLSLLVAGYPLAEFPVHSQPELIAAMKHTPFTQLHTLKVLLHTTENTFPAQYVRILLQKAHQLQYLHLSFIHSFTDQVLEQVLSENPLQALSECHLESCHGLSGAAVQRLIDTAPVLSSLSLKYCSEITRQDFTHFCKLCRDNNYEMNIEWM